MQKGKPVTDKDFVNAPHMLPLLFVNLTPGYTKKKKKKPVPPRGGGNMVSTTYSFAVWILDFGLWADTGVWVDTEQWVDG